MEMGGGGTLLLRQEGPREYGWRRSAHLMEGDYIRYGSTATGVESCCWEPWFLRETACD